MRPLLEIHAYAQLDFPLGKICSESQRLAGQKLRAAVNIERRSKRWSNFIVDRGIVCPVQKIECIRSELQAAAFAHFEAARQAQVEIGIVGANSRIAAGARWPVSKIGAITIHVSPGIEIEWARTVVLQKWCEFESTQDR